MVIEDDKRNKTENNKGDDKKIIIEDDVYLKFEVYLKFDVYLKFEVYECTVGGM